MKTNFFIGIAIFFLCGCAQTVEKSMSAVYADYESVARKEGVVLTEGEDTGWEYVALGHVAVRAQNGTKTVEPVGKDAEMYGLTTKTTGDVYQLDDVLVEVCRIAKEKGGDGVVRLSVKASEYAGGAWMVDGMVVRRK